MTNTPLYPAAAPADGTPDSAVYCGLLAVDITGSARHDDDTQVYLRRHMHHILGEAFHRGRLPWARCRRWDRGDGALIASPSWISPELLLDPLAHHIRAGLRAHNKASSIATCIRLRMAVHAGWVRFDDYGITGRTVTHLCRMLDAPEFRAAASRRPNELALITSSQLMSEAVRHGAGNVDPTAYEPLTIRCKETRASTWIWRPR